VLPAELAQQLALVAPSGDGRIAYHPCAVELRDGSVHERVYVQDAQSYILVWGVWPEDDPGKRSVDISQVVGIRESPDRLPPSIARAIYEAGESGMGYTVFTLIFRDGLTQAYISGNAVDFVSYPPGKSSRDVESVAPHEGRDNHPLTDSIGYAWCLHGAGVSDRTSMRWAGWSFSPNPEPSSSLQA
jgi:hypothetical protein